MMGHRWSENNEKLTVFVHSTTGGEIASKLNGHFLIGDQEFRFRAIAFGRIGGHNISLDLSKKTIQRIRKLGLDPDEIHLSVQRKIIEGDVVLPKALKLQE
ncbi:hypothetical protein [Nitrososphaera sp. AFS]|jgi:hypothetical protein|uniref:hypothetical protein n=1 Tax=Nitrososphaera sp. AFS TaxID=2301191 RepID=UPI0013924104|nr:hypothetical protein [Nitrososphaera sp. AFS]NAL77079.1 hypothetical protein [Nitrososphaera sp. AFS]